jgi:hypothetical protein
MTKGMPYDQALAEADRAERKEQRRAGDLGKFTQGWRMLPEAARAHKQLWNRLENGVSVWIVSGRLVRSVDVDFTEGGHDSVYEFIPEGEVWIDDDVEEAERGYVLVQELRLVLQSGSRRVQPN